MGARKRISAEARKEAQKTMYFAKLNNVPTSPRKMRLVADMIRGMSAMTNDLSSWYLTIPRFGSNVVNA